MKCAFVIAPLTVLAATCAGQLCADILHLENGGKVEGIVKDAGKNYEVETITGLSTISKDQVLMYERKECILNKYYEAAAKVKADDVEGHFALALLCKEGKWTSKMRFELNKVIELNPDHERARAELGHVKYEGKWMTRDEMYQAKGYVKFEGQWVSHDYMKQVDEWKKNILAIEKREQKINKLLWNMAARSAKVREKALADFIVAAKEAGMGNAQAVGKEVEGFYADAWERIMEIERQNVVAEVWVADARIVNVRNMDIAQGSEPFPVIMQLPAISIMSAKTTTIIPVIVRVSLRHPPRPEFREE